ncbi:hypothetical protein CK203_056239 [Vitis vinifera]|uniref:Uncharacterized protein n=1 Tax=Vitis vinifera TaxID=29760 RepID=A0A438GJK0_VITVI|nr:hypothetical protein CK203_056239 [Vitis vinifera]
MFFIDALLRHNIFPLQHWVQRRGVLLEALFRISKGYFFGPHHLIMAALLYFEEKMHRKKLLRVDAIPLLFPRLLCQILEHLGYPVDPQHEHQGAPAGPKQPEEPVEIPADTQPPAPAVASSEPPPEAQHTAILRQIQHRLDITSAPDHAIPSPPEPSQASSFVDQPMPHEEPPTGEAAEPSFPQHHPPTI